MNWLNDQNSQDNSICPRKKPPLGHGVQSVPRVQPQVPELSIFLPLSDRNLFDRDYARSSTNRNPIEQDSLGSVRVPVAPIQHRQPVSNLWKPNSDLSVMFQDTLDLSVSRVNIATQRETVQAETQNFENVEENNLSESEPKPVHQNVSLIPENIYKVIQWQTEQILILKEQVKQLMEAKSIQTLGTNTDQNSACSRTSNLPEPCEIDSRAARLPSVDKDFYSMEEIQAFHNESRSSQSSSRSNSIAETPKITTKQGANVQRNLISHNGLQMQETRATDASYLPQNLKGPSENQPFQAVTSSNGQAANPRITNSQHMTSSNGQPGNNRVMNVPQGLPRQEQQQQHDSISFCSSLNALHGEIECDRDVIPPDNIDDIIYRESGYSGPGESSIQVPRPSNPREDCSTLARLREMGVSFINKEDLMMNSKSGADGTLPDSTMMWYPKAAENLGMNSIVASTSEYSLMLNSAALKYLNDAQLASMAERSPRSSQQKSANIQALAPSFDMSRFGMPEDRLSDATRHFLSQHNLSKN